MSNFRRRFLRDRARAERLRARTSSWRNLRDADGRVVGMVPDGPRFSMKSYFDAIRRKPARRQRKATPYTPPPAAAERRGLFQRMRDKVAAAVAKIPVREFARAPRTLRNWTNRPGMKRKGFGA